MKRTSLQEKIKKTVVSFFDADTTYYAASLSFYTIFAIFPILALGVAFLSNTIFFANYTETFISYALAILNPSSSSEFENFAKSFLHGTENLGTIGIFYSIFVFTMFFKDYEGIVNKICKTKNKKFYKSFFVYLAFVAIFPIFYGAFLAIISFVSNQFYSFLFSFLFSYFVIFVVFKISIQRKIDTKELLISSFVTLIVLLISHYLFFEYASINSKTYETIYGSFSVILLFFLWIYINWIIFLYGISLAFKLHLIKKAKLLAAHL